MELKFTHLPHQQEAVEAVTGCFKGQPHETLFAYNIDPGRRKNSTLLDNLEVTGFRNQTLKINEDELLRNIQKMQSKQDLPISPKLATDKISSINLDVEMETGTGKTYCYTKTIFELNKFHGWSKFIIVVPSVAIREGVYKSFKITTNHFLQMYGKAAHCFIYSSSELNELESFASGAGIKVMIINIQAFNAKGAANRRIYDELDDFQSRKPIDVIAATRPIIIMDEPQKMEGGKTLDSLGDFKPLMVLRYSATHRTHRNLIHRLDTGSEVVVYAKLPRGFFIPTPVGDYHPGWAIVFDEAKVRHIYFVAETKGNLSSLELRQIEKDKIECARRFFGKLNQALPTPLNQNPVTYDVIDSYSKLMELVKPCRV